MNLIQVAVTTTILLDQKTGPKGYLLNQFFMCMIKLLELLDER